MLKLDASDSYSWPVTVEIATDGGKFSKFTFDATFKRLSRTAAMELMRKIRDNEVDDIEVAKSVLIGWKGIEDVDGNPLPFSETALDRVLDKHPVCPSVIQALVESLKGGKAKN